MTDSMDDLVAVEFVVKNISKIVDVFGRVSCVFPPYKLNMEELKTSYRVIAEALARKNLLGYDSLSAKNKKIAEIYEIASALQEIAGGFLKEVVEMSKNSRSKKLLTV